MAAVWHASPQKMVGVLFALLLAAAMAVGSGANFTSSVSASATAAAGNMKLTGDTTSIFNVSNMKPSDVKSGTITLTNTGSVAADLSTTMGTVADTPGPGGGKLGDKLNLRVVQTDSTGTTETGGDLYNGLIKNFGSSPLALAGNVAGGGAKTYKFEVSWAPGATDNTFQGSSVTMPFTFDAVQH